MPPFQASLNWSGNFQDCKEETKSFCGCMCDDSADPVAAWSEAQALIACTLDRGF
jgi:hypothetical protein